MHPKVPSWVQGNELNKDGVYVVGCVANISGFAVQKVELLIKKGVCVE